jgi:hypothetical protein
MHKVHQSGKFQYNQECNEISTGIIYHTVKKPDR